MSSVLQREADRLHNPRESSHGLPGATKSKGRRFLIIGTLRFRIQSQILAIWLVRNRICPTSRVFSQSLYYIQFIFDLNLVSYQEIG